MNGAPTFTDAVGVARGVPEEFKLADQIAGGFETIFTWITVNRNIDWINYINYNVQLLTNLIRDATEGVSSQLSAKSLMVVQNHMVIDLLLAEKGGACFLFEERCCTYIPSNTAPDGSGTKALQGLRTLSTQLKELSGVGNPFSNFMSGLFGRYKGLAFLVVISLAVMVSILVPSGYYCIPCIRFLREKTIETAI